MKYIIGVIGALLIAGTAFAATGGLTYVSEVTHAGQIVTKYTDKDTGANCYVAQTSANTVAISCLPKPLPVQVCDPKAKGC